MRLPSLLLPRAWFGLLGVALAAACTPEIGDKCAVSTDCSIRGDRLCDTSQPGGYCTQLNCRAGTCADESTCVLFNSAIPGCGYDDRAGLQGSRVARSFCMAQCESNGDCRAGYVCADPRSYPWNAVILDDNQTRRGCLPLPLEGQDAGPDASSAQGSAAVCRPPTDAAAPIDASDPAIYSPATPPLFPDPPRDAGSDG